ncbi:MAG: hypothetical protein J3K34DRAFT_459679 [Monoraphidium minutum]|nr:MAG: hypothetical protein J3K34DRAFT_459679 [Monoraphidium minutum]
MAVAESELEAEALLPSEAGALHVTPALEFRDPALEAAWRAHAARHTYARLDACVTVANAAANAALAALGGAARPGDAARFAALSAADGVFAAAQLYLLRAAPAAYARNRVRCVAALRLLRLVLLTKAHPQTCPGNFNLGFWLVSSSSGNVLISLLLLPLRWHLPLQAAAAAVAVSHVPRACACAAQTPGALGALAEGAARAARLHAAAGLPLLPYGAAAPAAGDPAACGAVLSGLALLKALGLTTAFTLLAECAARAAWLARLLTQMQAAPGGGGGGGGCAAAVRCARRELTAFCAVNLAVVAACLPMGWEMVATLAHWAAAGGPPGWLAVAAFSTAVAIQCFMRLWLLLVLRLLVAQPLLLWARRHDARRLRGCGRGGAGGAAGAPAAPAAAGAATARPEGSSKACCSGRGAGNPWLAVSMAQRRLGVLLRRGT